MRCATRAESRDQVTGWRQQLESPKNPKPRTEYCPEQSNPQFQEQKNKSKKYVKLPT